MSNSPISQMVMLAKATPLQVLVDTLDQSFDKFKESLITNNRDKEVTSYFKWSLTLMEMKLAFEDSSYAETEKRVSEMDRLSQFMDIKQN